MHAHKCLGPWIQLQRRTESRKTKRKRKVTNKAGSYFMPASQSDCLTQIPFQLFFPKMVYYLPQWLVVWTTCRNKSITSVWLVAGVHSQPIDHVRGEEGQRGDATSTSTHTQPDSLQRTCRAGSSLRVWPRSRSLHRLLHATSCRISCPWTPWSSSLHSGKNSEDEKDQQQRIWFCYIECKTL